MKKDKRECIANHCNPLHREKEERCTQDQQVCLQYADASRGHGTSHHHEDDGSLTSKAFIGTVGFALFKLNLNCKETRGARGEKKFYRSGLPKRLFKLLP